MQNLWGLYLEGCVSLKIFMITSSETRPYRSDPKQEDVKWYWRFYHRGEFMGLDCSRSRACGWKARCFCRSRFVNKSIFYNGGKPAKHFEDFGWQKTCSSVSGFNSFSMPLQNVEFENAVIYGISPQPGHPYRVASSKQLLDALL